jgi:cytochrome P450
MAATPYGETWRRKRKLMHAHVHQGVVHRYEPIQLATARRLARELLAARTGHENLEPIVRLNLGQTIIKAVYGLDVESADSEYISLPERVLEFGNAVINAGSVFMIDVFPFCASSQPVLRGE